MWPVLLLDFKSRAGPFMESRVGSTPTRLRQPWGQLYKLRSPEWLPSCLFHFLFSFFLRPAKDKGTSLSLKQKRGTRQIGLTDRIPGMGRSHPRRP